MNSSFLKVIDELNQAKNTIERLWEEGRRDLKGFENREAYYLIENILEKMDNAAFQLKRLSLPQLKGRYARML